MESKEPLKIVELTSSNVKRLRAVNIRPDGSLVIIGGRNGQGKSSVLDSIMFALAGTKGLPPKPVRDGEEEAEVVVDLGEFIVVRTMQSGGGTSLIVKSANGARFPSPQTMLDKFINSLSFDPLDFTRQDAKTQGKTLMRLVGLDFAALDAKRKAAFDERTNVNRDAKAAKANLDAAPKYPDAPECEVAAQSIIDELDAANQKNSANAKVRANADTVALRLSEAREYLAELEAQVVKAKSEVGKWESQQSLAEKALANLVDVDTEPIRKRIAAVDQDNAKVRANAEHAKLKARVSELDKKSGDLTKKIEECDAEREKAIASAAYPVPGLAVNDEGILFNGIPLEQASSAEQLRVSVAIGLALNPRLRVMAIRDGSLLDADSMSLLRELAEANGAQLWIERVGKADEGAIIIEDGSVEAKTSA